MQTAEIVTDNKVILISSNTINMRNEYSFVVLRNEDDKVIGSFYQPLGVTITNDKVPS